MRPWSAIFRNASRPLASRLAHHQYPMMLRTIAVPAIIANGWASDQSLTAGDTK